MNKGEIIKKTAAFAKSKFNDSEGSHDWWHTYRVWQLAKRIAKEEKADLFIVEMGALLHDIWDRKLSDQKTAEEDMTKYLQSLNMKKADVENIKHILNNVSFSNTFTENKIKNIEGKIIQDADKLDAIGAIGIARTFAYGGRANRPIYDPYIKPKNHRSKESYTNSRSHSINHFHEKLLLLKDMINTKTARRMAKRRHEFTKKYLKEFFVEWEGKQ